MNESIGSGGKTIPGWKVRAWLSADIPRAPYISFRVAFAAIWLVYDVLDLRLGGTRGYLWAVWDGNYELGITGLQVILIAAQGALLVGIFPRSMAFMAFLARALETKVFAMNDFVYCSVMLLLLSQCDCRNPWNRSAPAKAAAWPRDVFILQAAWIYLMTAFLKLNPPFLSGGDSFARQNYSAEGLGWPYPHFYRVFISSLAGNAVLAWAAVVAEVSLAVVLAAWVFQPARRKPLRRAAIFIVVGIHGFAMAALNVFFFGASMIALVTLLTWEPWKRGDCRANHTIPS